MKLAYSSLLAVYILLNNTILGYLILLFSVLKVQSALKDVPLNYLLLFLFCLFFSVISLIITMSIAGYIQNLIYPIKALFSLYFLGITTLYFRENHIAYWNFIRFIAIGQIVLFIYSILINIPTQWSGDTYIGFFSNRNTFAFASTVIFSSLVVSFIFISKDAKDILLAMLIFILILLSQSRAALGCSLFSLLAFSYYFKQTRFMLVFVFCFFSLSILILEPLVPIFGSLLSSIRFEDEAANTFERLSVWGTSIGLIKNNPIFGVGFYKTGDYLILGTHAHNIFLQYLSDFGLFGLFFLVFVFFPLTRGVKQLSDPKIFIWAPIILYSLVTLPIASPTSALIIGALTGLTFYGRLRQ